MSYPFFSRLSVFLPGYPFYLTAIRFFVSFRRKQKKDPFYTKTRLTRYLRNPISQNCRKELVPKCFLPSSLISHWKTTCLFHKNEADQAFFVITIIVLSFSFLFSSWTTVQILNLIFWMKIRTTTVFWPVWGPTDVVLIFIQSFIYWY